MERLVNFNVTLKNADKTTQATKHFAGGAQTQIYTFDQIVNDVRYVRVHFIGSGYLTLAEVQVFGKEKAIRGIIPFFYIDALGK